MKDQEELLGQLFAVNSAVNAIDFLQNGCQQDFANLSDENEALRSRIARLEEVIAQYYQCASALAAAATGPNGPCESARTPLAKASVADKAPFKSSTAAAAIDAHTPVDGRGFDGPHSLTTEEVVRYGRHLLVPAFGVEGQDRLKAASVLVVGAGGLGSPALLYLAASGIGRLGICDYDKVEVHNLHRQVIHTESTLGMPKALSAAQACRRLNSSLAVTVHNEPLTPQNALAIVSSYDVVMDGSDNVGTRYLLNDACVVAHKPLVSAGCIGTDGQLTVYHWGDDGPCYRCLFPTPPPADACQRCSDTGVLGVVPGILGCLQALEVIKVVTRRGRVMSRRLLLVDALAGRIQTVTLRPKVPECIACGADASITRDSLPSINYTGFTGAGLDDKPPCSVHLLVPEQRVSPADLAQMFARGQILDVGRLHAKEGQGRVPEEKEGSRSSGLLAAGSLEHQAGSRRASQNGGVNEGGQATVGEATAGVDAQPSGQAALGQPTIHVGAPSGPLQGCVLLDVRPAHEFAIASLAPSWNVPFSSLQTQEGLNDVVTRLCGEQGGDGGANVAGMAADRVVQEATVSGSEPRDGDKVDQGSDWPGARGSLAETEGGRTERHAAQVVVLCRRGNDSQIVTDMLNRAGAGKVKAVDLAGGLQSWGHDIDPRFPLY